jgi:hypothetical protein
LPAVPPKVPPTETKSTAKPASTPLKPKKEGS